MHIHRLSVPVAVVRPIELTLTFYRMYRSHFLPFGQNSVLLSIGLVCSRCHCDGKEGNFAANF